MVDHVFKFASSHQMTHLNPATYKGSGIHCVKTNFQNIVVGVLCFLEMKLAKLSHYTVIAMQVFVIAHVSPKQIETLC